MKFFTIVALLLSPLLGTLAPVCNLCDYETNLYSDHLMSLNYTLCNFEIKYHLMYLPTCNVSLALPWDDYYYDVFTCSNNRTYPGPFRVDMNGSYTEVERLDIAEVNCEYLPDSNHLTLDLYRPIRLLNGTQFPVRLMKQGIDPIDLSITVS
jgi:hypothetical protein